MNVGNTPEPEPNGHRLLRRLSDRHYSLTFSLNAFNLLNHTNFGEFNGVVSAPRFGRPNRANDPRRIHLGVSLSFLIGYA